jgi:hypothetical protein
MAKISLEMSYTLDYTNKIISFGKITAKVEEIDLDKDAEEQLANFDKTMEATSVQVHKYLKGKVMKVFEKKSASNV